MKKNNKIKIKEQELDYRYGITKEQFDELQVKADGKCEICKNQTKLHIDHDHNVGFVRGLLCPACNHGIGNFKDDIKLLQAAIEYLERNRCKIC